ncbi:MAG: glycan-binding surface protein [Bacteroidales bacterium]|nr:glycan-binding surface protein [Bacteroidales bacterium]MCL2132972.1 glycan-binding surface protein [Bacteroidales bacterium]
MNTINIKKVFEWVAVAGMISCAALISSCKENNEYPSNNDKVVVKSVHLSDAKDVVLDRTVSFARLGQLIRIDGTGFLGMQKVYINGVSAYFNPTLMSNTSMIVKVPNDAPTVEATEDVRNTIRFVKSDDNQLVYTFEIRMAAPTITNISHTLPQAGERIYIYGTNLYEIHKITFPGNVTVTTGIESDDEEGTYCTLIVPAGITQSGSVLVEGSAGGAYSPGYFNFREGLFMTDFSSDPHHGWSSGVSGNLTDIIPATGDGPKSQGIYRAFNEDGDLIPAGRVDAGFYWANSTNWSSVYTESVMPSNTPTSLSGVQMDVYFEGEWNSGTIRFVIADGSGAQRYCMWYTPWVENGRRVDFPNPNGWFTITLPFSDSPDYVDKTFAEVTNSVNTANYKQWGPHFDNTDITTGSGASLVVLQASEPTNVIIYMDNFRIVPLDVPTYSDYE